MRYYKTIDEKTWFKSKTPHHEKCVVEISEEQYNAHFVKPEPTHVVRERHEPTEEELALREKKKQISRFKAFLKDTDWVIVKIAEETDAEQIAALREKYADIIALRKNARTQINELEGE